MRRGLLLWTMLVTLGTVAACAASSDQVPTSGAATPAGSATSGPAPATPQQIFNSGQTVQTVTPGETRMLGPAANGASALSLVPGF
jgi:hypothetical protein